MGRVRAPEGHAGGRVAPSAASRRGRHLLLAWRPRRARSRTSRLLDLQRNPRGSGRQVTRPARGCTCTEARWLGRGNGARRVLSSDAAAAVASRRRLGTGDMNGKTKMKVSISVSKSAVPPGPAARSAALTSLASTSVPRAYVHIRIEVLVANERSGGDNPWRQSRSPCVNFTRDKL